MRYKIKSGCEILEKIGRLKNKEKSDILGINLRMKVCKDQNGSKFWNTIIIWYKHT